jgi:polyhydroxyalkanoate synthesis regulator phasin
MQDHKNYELKNHRVIMKCIDGILIDGSNLIHMMVHKGEFAFRKLITLHTNLCRVTGLQPRKIKIILDENMPYLLGVKATGSGPKSIWSASISDIEKFNEINQHMSEEDRYLLIAYHRSADELISDMIKQNVLQLNQNWFVLSNDSYDYLQDGKISNKIDTLVRNGKIKLEERDNAIRNLKDKLRTLKQIIDDDKVVKNNRRIKEDTSVHNMHCRRLRYSDYDDSIKYLDYTVGKDLHIRATRNSSNLIKQRKVKLLKYNYL